MSSYRFINALIEGNTYAPRLLERLDNRVPGNTREQPGLRVSFTYQLTIVILLRILP